MFRLELPGLGLGLRLGVFFLKHSNMQMMRVVGFEHSFLHAPLNFLSSPGYLNSDGRMSRANITMVAYLILVVSCKQRKPKIETIFTGHRHNLSVIVLDS